MKNVNETILQKRVYQSNNNYSIKIILKESIYAFYSSLFLARQFASRDIKSQFRQSLLGYFWAIAPIILTSVLWIFLQTTGTIKLSDTGIPYPAFVVIGITFFTLVSDCLLMTINTITSNKSVITKINFEKEALITVGIYKLLFNLIIKLLLVAIILVVFKVKLTITIIYFIPLLLLTILFFSAIGIIMTPIGILYNDIAKALPLLMQVIMYITPVLYTKPQNGIMQIIMRWNPLTYFIVNLRNTLTGAPLENITFLVIIFFLTIILSGFSLIVYRVSMPIITERMSA